MTREEAKSCIGTIEMLQRLAYNIHGVMDVIDADNCKKIIKALEQEPKTVTVKQLEEMYDSYETSLWREHEDVRGDDMVELGTAELLLQEELCILGCWDDEVEE